MAKFLYITIIPVISDERKYGNRVTYLAVDLSFGTIGLSPMRTRAGAFFFVTPLTPASIEVGAMEDSAGVVGAAWAGAGLEAAEGAGAFPMSFGTGYVFSVN